jgi:hypothetical protein
LILSSSKNQIKELPILVVSKISKNHWFHEKTNKNPTILGGYLIFQRN